MFHHFESYHYHCLNAFISRFLLPKSIQQAHRFGRPKSKLPDGSKPKPRPIIVLFSDYKEKESIRSKRSDLDKPYSIAEDLPGEIRLARKTLHGKVEATKKPGKKATIIYPAQLLIDGNIIESVDPAKFSLN